MIRPLRLAIWYNLPSGGAKRALFYHVRGLRQRGHVMKAWHPPLEQSGFASFNGLIDEHELPLDILAEGGSYLDKILRHVRRPYLLMESMRRHSAACAREMETGKWDLLFSNTCMYFGSPFIARYSKLPSVLYLQEPHRPFFEPMPRLPWAALPESTVELKKRLRDRFDIASARVQLREELENAQAHQKILVNSYFSRESVLRAYGVGADVCYLGIDTSLFEDRGLAREPFVIGLGTIGPTKNVRLAIEAVGAIKGPKPVLEWVGNMTDDVYVPQMKALAESLGVDFRPRVMVTDEELVDLLNRAAAMIYAPRLEPFGLAPLEANACGCAVVAVAEGGVRETIVDGVNGRLVPSDPQAVGEAVRKMIEDPVGSHAMGQEAKRLVHERWNLESSVDRLEAALAASVR